MSEFRRIMMQRQSMGELPIGYTALEYIGSNGVAYINTEVKPKPNGHRLWIDLSLNEVDVTKALLGSRTNATAGNKYACNIFVIKNTLRLDWIGSSKSIPASTGTRYEIDCINNTVKVNGVTYSSNVTKSSTELIGSILLFNINTETTPDNRIINAKIYGCKIWNENGELIRNFTPVKNPSGVCGLFDKVNKVFYGSANNYSLIGG